MNIKRTIAAILAFLALASFAGCKGEKKDNSTSTSAEAAGAQASEAENGSEAAESASTSQAATAEESKYPQYYIDMSGVNWNHWTLHKERDLSYFEKTPKDISILNNDFDFDDRGNLVLTIAYEDDNRENCNGSVGCKYTYNSDGTIKRADFTDGYATSESYEYDSAKRLVKTVSVSRDKAYEPKTTYYTYNSAGLLTSEKCYSGGKKLIDSKDFKYNTDGKITECTISVSENKTQGITTYEYDRQGNCVLEKHFDLNRKATGNKEFKYDKNGFVIYQKETNLKSNGIAEIYYTLDKYENPTAVKVYLTTGGKKDLKYEHRYSYDYGKSEIKVTGKIIAYDSDGTLILDGTRIYKYHETKPTEMYFANLVSEFSCNYGFFAD